MGKSTISMAIFNSFFYKLPEGNPSMAKSPPSEAITYNDRSVLESFHAADPRRSRFRFRQARKKDQIHHPMIMCIYIFT
jgi:hypothetical protein